MFKTGLAKGLLLSMASLGACDDLGWVHSNSGEDLANAALGMDASTTVPCRTTVVAAPGTVILDSGPIIGTLNGASYSFKGIPYAAPPVGALRWKAPTAPACWSEPRSASAFGSICPQRDPSGQPTGDEDCLYLNVWAPATAPAQPLPVMFWIHGGGNIQGAGSLPVYDGQYLAEHGHAIVVTINYRLGTLGFLVHPSLAKESANGVSGNYGNLDQIAALEWVQRNITRFGGDPARVLVFGESAGAVNTCVLLASPLARGLFSRALMESGACYQKPPTAFATQTAQFTDSAGCAASADVPGCLRALSSTQVLSALATTGNPILQSSGAFAPIVDGYVLRESPIRALADSTFNHMPFIVGSNSDETSKSVDALMPPIADLATYQSVVQKQFGATASQVLAMYPAADYRSPRAAYIALTTDSRFICVARQTARAAAAGQKDQPVRRYYFTHGIENAGAPARIQGAWHGEELFFVFHNFSAGMGYKPSAAESKLSDEVIGYWSRFASSGDPNDPMSTPWPIYEPNSDTHLVLDDTIAAGSGVRSKQCDFWDQLALPGM